MQDNENDKVDEVDLLGLIGIIYKNLKWIVGITLLFIIGVLIYSIISIILPPEDSYLPNQYSPKALIIINSSEDNSINSMLSGSGLTSIASLAGIPVGGAKTSNRALAKKLVSTNTFLDKIANEFDLGDVYNTHGEKFPKTILREKIDSKLSLSVDEDSGILEISYTDINKELATNIVNRVTDHLEEDFSKIDAIRNRDQTSLIEDKMSIVEDEMKSLQNSVIEFQTKYNIMDVDIVSNELVSQVARLQENLLLKEVEIESYGKVSNIKDPGYIKLINERDAILNSIKKLENGEVGNFPPLKDLPKLSLEINKLKQEAEIKVTAYKALVAQYETLKLTSEGTGPVFQILEYAETPERKSGPSRGLLCIIVTFAGFIISILFVFMKEFWLNIKHDPEKMKRIKGVQ